MAIAPAALKQAAGCLRAYTGLDGCYTALRFRMMLLIVVRIDANDNILPLAWALVPTENTEWWLWFMRFLRAEFPIFKSQNYVFVSDREKGILEAISTVFLEALAAHCCQHIADNVQSKYGLAARKAFWKVA